MRILSLLLLLCCGLLSVHCKIDAAPQAKTKPVLLLRNGKIWTGNAQTPLAEALLIRDERIVAVGLNEAIDKLKPAGAQVIDLGGKLAVPGFIDNHTHFFNGGANLLSVNLRDAENQVEFALRLGAFAAKLPKGRWILGGDWDHERWPEAQLPTKELIDQLTPNNPVFVQRLDGHMGLANSLALKLAKITKESKDPPGGTIVRDPKTGEPTGVLKDAAMTPVFAVIPPPTEVERQEALTAALKEAARLGLTSIQDMASFEELRTYLTFRDSGRLTVRVYARTPIPQWERQRDAKELRQAGDDWVRLGGLKGFMDGSLGSTTAYFFAPYLDAPGSTGLLADQMFPDGIMLKRILGADKAGLQVSIHAIGDKANKLLLDIFEQVARQNGPRDRRFRNEHTQHLRPEDMPRFKQLGVIAAMQPYHAIDDGRWAEKRIGRERARTTYAFRSLLDSGAVLAFGSDWPVAPLSPILGLYGAVTRRTLDDKNPDGWIPEQKITVEEAVRAYTAASAYAEFAETKKGRLEAGKLGDVVVLSQDIFTIKPAEIAKTEVLYTIVGGRVVYRKDKAGD